MSQSWGEEEWGMSDDELFKHRMAKAVAVVEASHTEMHFLWMQYAQESTWADSKYPSRKMKWQQANPGRAMMIGKIGRREVWLSIVFNRIEDQMVIFWELTSPACDYNLVDPWFAKAFGAKGWPTYDKGSRTATFDAMNFGNAVSAIRQAAGLEK